MQKGGSCGINGPRSCHIIHACAVSKLPMLCLRNKCLGDACSRKSSKRSMGLELLKTALFTGSIKSCSVQLLRLLQQEHRADVICASVNLSC